MEWLYVRHVHRNERCFTKSAEGKKLQQWTINIQDRDRENQSLGKGRVIDTRRKEDAIFVVQW